jgi:hypothetical protein
MPIHKGQGANPVDIFRGDDMLMKVYLGDDLVWHRVPYPLYGTMRYYNYFGDDVNFKPKHTPTVTLLDADMNVINSVVVEEGEFVFENRSELRQTKYIRAYLDCPHGGLSATDLLAVHKVANGQEDAIEYWNPKTFLNAIGDVDGDGVITSTDTEGAPSEYSKDTDAQWLYGRLIFSNDPDWFFHDAENNLRDWCFYDRTKGSVFDYETKDSGLLRYRYHKRLDIWVRPYGDVLGNYNIAAL